VSRFVDAPRNPVVQDPRHPHRQVPERTGKFDGAMRPVVPSFLLIAVSAAHAQSLFDPEVIHTIQIQFAQPNWDHLLDSMALAYDGTGTGEGRLTGTVTIDGTVYDSCGVRYKGNSTYNPLQEKNPLNIDLNWVIAGQDHQGTDKIKLANGASDPSMVREMTMYELAREVMHAPRAAYTKVWINGDYKGLYLHTEDLGNEFLDAHFGTSAGAFFKCDPRGFVLYGDNSNLAWHPDSMAYDTLYDMQSNGGLAELRDLCYELEFNAGSIADHLDVDRVLWFHALSNAFVHLDGYYAFAHNYYMYKDKNDRWDPIPWDVNMAFGGLVFDGVIPLPLNTTQLSQLHPFHLAFSLDYRPLIGRIILQPLYAAMYMAHYRTIMEEMVWNGHYLDRATHWHQLIDAEMQDEPYPLFPYAEFAANLTADVGAGFTLRPGIEAIMQQRESYLDTLSGMYPGRPVINGPVFDPPAPLPFDQVDLTVQIDDALGATIGTRRSRFDRFVWQVLYDDGLHDDGAALDGLFGAQIQMGAGDLQYVLFAYNDSAGRFSPSRAEHEWHVLSVQPGVVLNEAQASNATTHADQNGEHDDWIELYNNGNVPVDLAGFHLSDDPADPAKWTFPDTVIAPQGFLIAWADEDGGQAGLHANFKLAASGEPLLLSDPMGNVVDETAMPSLQADATWGRYPNGTGEWTVLVPTFSGHNSIAIGVQEEAIGDAAWIRPSIGDGVFTVMRSDGDTQPLRVMTSTGGLVLDRRITGHHATIDLSGEAEGLYLVRIGDRTLRAVVAR